MEIEARAAGADAYITKMAASKSLLEGNASAGRQLKPLERLRSPSLKPA